MLVAVTGTPGTGKSSACALLERVTVIDLNKLAEEHAEDFTYDEERGSLEIDPPLLKRLIPRGKGIVVMEGHVAHLMDPDITIVLRCSPKILRKRLAGRGWPNEKVLENVEAEAVDVVLIDALDSCKSVFEIDTTSMTPKQVADAISSIIAGEKAKYRPGNIDWSGEVLDWY